tara:strand:+ start:47 stop:862 length:816 start_codon:yes stop_codon:yes gene_type:complete
MPLKYEYFGRLIYVYLFCFSIFYICHDNLKDKFLSNVIFIFAILVSYKYERFSGLQEILIFSILAILSKFYFKIQNNQNSQNIINIISIILGINLLIWIKAEGIVYATILIIIINMMKQISNKIKIYIFSAYAFLILFKFIVYSFFDMVINGQPFYTLDYILNIEFSYLIYKIKILSSYLLYYGMNNFYFVAGLIILLSLNIQKKSYNYLNSLNYYFLLSTIFIFLAYLLRDLEIEYFAKTTLERIIFLSSGFYVFLVISFLKKFNSNFLK